MVWRFMLEIIATVELDRWYEQPLYQRESWLRQQLNDLYRVEFQLHERILLRLNSGDEWVSETDGAGLILQTVQKLLNQIDISNFFVIILTDPVSGSTTAQEHLRKISADSVPLVFDCSLPAQQRKPVKHNKVYQYNSVDPVRVALEQLPDRHRSLLSESKSFCIYPWIHLHAYPTGEAWPCCHAEMKAGKVGDCKQNTVQEIWNGERMKSLRMNMLSDRPDPLCIRCYEQEKNGFFSGRLSANKHHGHHVDRVDETNQDGTLDRFEMTYWDIRFSNLCNLSCRSCGHIFSSSWYQDQIKLAGPEWAKRNRVLNYAGRTETDIWEQLVPHFDYVEQIYFAGGEPLMMDEHYRILEELERRGRFDVRLIYNTNFTQVKLKDRLVFDYWKKFNSVAVGASLDAMGNRGEFMRKGTDWPTVERNRLKMLEICPDVDFYISPTLSIMNALHLPDFHRDWVDRGLLQPQDLNVNVLQDPEHYRIDIAPAAYKDRMREKIQQHLEWLRPQDRLNRATQGFESAINFMDATDNSHLISKFWSKSQQLDNIRSEEILQVIPELKALL